MATAQVSQNRVYLFRLQTLIIDGGTTVVRNIFDEKSANVPLNILLHNEKPTMNRLRANKTITKTQFDLLYPQSGQSPTTADFDLTLSICLLRNLKCCGLNKHFAWNTIPHAGDTSLEADLCRLRNFRNEVAHISFGITHNTFMHEWWKIEKVLIRLNTSVENPVQNLQQQFDEYKNSPLDEVAEKRIEGEIKKWRKFEKELESELQRVKKDVQEVKHEVGNGKNEVHAVKKHVTTEVGNVKDEVHAMEKHVTTEVGNVKGKVSVVTETVGKIKEEINAVTENVDEIKENIAELERRNRTQGVSMKTLGKAPNIAQRCFQRRDKLWRIQNSRMAQSLPTQTTIAHLSRQAEQDVHCQPCLLEDVILDPVAYCRECDEYLCLNCKLVHGKMKISRNHTVTEISRCPEVYPGRPWATDIQSDSITLVWNPPTEFRDGDYYQISYKDVNKDRKWKTDESEHTTTSITVTHLKPNTNYIFRLRVVHEDGEEGPLSKESEEIQTLASQASRLVEISRICWPNDGSPTVYVLPLTEMKLARNVKAKSKWLTLGKPPPGGYVESKTILLVGATGTGKSTFVDGIFNYVLGVTWEDPFRFTTKYTDEEKENKNMAVSQTDWIKCYTINPNKGSRLNYQLHIIDTPGFGDTRGLKRDGEIIDQIREFCFEKAPKGITDIDAVCFLIKAPDARLTAGQSYIFQSVMSLFGRDLQNNICSIITFADGREPPVLAAMLASGLPFGKSFLFNNSSLVAKNDINSETSLSSLFWDMGIKSYVAFFSYLGHIQAKNLQFTRDVLR